MRCVLLLLSIAACGSKPDAPPPPVPAAPPPTPTPAVAPAPTAKPGLIDDAARLAKKPNELLCVAHAFVALKNPLGARAALARLELEPGDFQNQISRLDVLELLGEDQRAAMKTAVAKRKPEDDPLVVAYQSVESPVGIEIAAAALLLSTDFATTIKYAALQGTLVPGTAKWKALFDKVPPEDDRRLLLGQLARQIDAKPIAHAIVAERAASNPTPTVVDELILQHDVDAARDAWKRTPEPSSTGMTLAIDLIERALVAMELGDRPMSEAFEARSIAAAASQRMSSRERDRFYAGHALVLQARGDSAKSRAIAYANVSPDGIAKLCRTMADHGWGDAAIELAGNAHPPSAPGSLEIFYIDMLRNDRTSALALYKAGKVGPGMMVAATAFAGDVDGVAELTHGDEKLRVIGVQRLAWALARKGVCDRAVEFAVNAPDAYTYATVARYCP